MSAPELLKEIGEQHSAIIHKVATGWRDDSFRAHAILLVGPAGIGKLESGRLIAHALLGGDSILGGKNTANYTEIGAPPETVADAESADRDKRESLKIDQFRELKELAKFADQRVVHVPEAERMTPQAANSLLKLLEEPPRGWKFILSSADPNLLLPTIVSRLQVVRMHPFSEAHLNAALERLTPTANTQSRQRVITLAQGSLKRALEFLDPDCQGLIGKIREFEQNPWESFIELIDLVAKGERNFEILLTVLENSCARELKRIVSPSGIFADETSARTARDRWVRISERLASARKQIRIPLNRKLVIQDILGEWAH